MVYNDTIIIYNDTPNEMSYILEEQSERNKYIKMKVISWKGLYKN